jgi:hypothetical protein
VPREALVVLAGVLVYFGVRGRTEGNVGHAMENGRLIMDVERQLGLDLEAQVQEPVRDSGALTTLMNWVYIWGHWPVIAATLVWLLRRHRSVYYVTRNAMLLSGAVGMVVFALFPVAPPRLMRLGLLDTVTEYSTSYRVLQPPGFVNQYAAMPSLHVGWDLLMGMAIASAAGSVWLRVVGWLLPALMILAVIATANHYVLDAVAGVLLVLACRMLVVRWSGGRALTEAHP